MRAGRTHLSPAQEHHGLWLVQQSKRAFDARGRQYEYGELARMAAKAPALRSIINPDDARFLNPRHAQGDSGILPRDQTARAEDGG